MRKSQIFALTMFLAVLVISSTITTSSACDYSKVGVREGDTADYWVHEITHLYGTNFTTGEPIYFYRDYTGQYNGFHIHLLVTYVEATNVTLSITCYYPNGTLFGSQFVTIDVSSGRASQWIPSWDFRLGSLLSYSGVVGLTASELGTGDPIYSGSNLVISESLIMIVGGAYRLVNHVAQDPLLSFPYSSYYWDKKSGLLLEKEFGLLSLLNGAGWGAMMVWWFNVSSTPLDAKEKPGEANPINPANEIAALLAGIAAPIMLIAMFAVADRRQRR